MVELPEYTNEEWLKHQYTDLRKSVQTIANEQEIPYFRIRDAMNEFKIPIRKCKGKNHPCWKGGISKKNSYKKVFHNGNTKPLYKVVMEEALGRPVKIGEMIHHIDLNKQNDYLFNLLLLKNRKIHSSIHVQFNRLARNLAKVLYNLGIITFDRKTLIYNINEKSIQNLNKLTKKQQKNIIKKVKIKKELISKIKRKRKKLEKTIKEPTEIIDLVLFEKVRQSRLMKLDLKLKDEDKK